MTFSFTVGFIGYGAYHHVGVNLSRVALQAEDPSRFEFLLWLNDCSSETLSVARSLHDAGSVAMLMEARRNINKCGAWQVFNQVCSTRYLLMLDDDVEVQRGWDTAIITFLKANPKFDLAGRLVHWGVAPGRDYPVECPDFEAYVKAHHWFNQEVAKKTVRDLTLYAWGGVRLLNVPFLRRWNFPDHRQLIQGEDGLLSELVRHRGKMLCLPSRVMKYFPDPQWKGRSRGEFRGGNPRAFPSMAIDPVTGEVPE
jgi:hypothetical protein